MRTFRDNKNVEWTVFEVRRDATSRADWSYLPSGYSDGWLCFESDEAKKRLLTYPPNWREKPDAELAGLLDQAQKAPRTSQSISADFLAPPDSRP